MRFSVTRLLTYEECPMKFKFRYLEQIPEAPSEAMEFGRYVHQRIAEELDVFQTPDDTISIDRIDEAEELVTKALNIAKTLGVIKDVERKFERKLSSNDKIVGIVDLITDEGIWDWKTGNARPKAFQIGLYGYYMQRNFNVAKMGYILLRTGQIVEFDTSFQEKAHDKMLYLIDKIKHDKIFSPKPGRCEFCSYIDMCPLNAVRPTKTPIRNVQEAKDVYSTIQFLKTSLRRKEMLLKEFVDSIGELKLDGVTYKSEVVPSYRLKKGIDKEAMIRELALKHPEAVKFDNKALFELFPQAFDVIERKTYKIERE